MINGIVAVGLIGSVVALATPRLPIIHTLCAGWFASLAIGTGEILRLLLVGWRLSLAGLAGLVLLPLVSGGAAAALTDAAAVQVLVTTMRRVSGFRRLRGATTA